MKLAVLYTRLSGYIAACLEAFTAQSGAELLIIAWPAQKNAPFAANSFSCLGGISDRSKLSRKQIGERLRSFGPDAVLVSGWVDPGYTVNCWRLKATGVPVISGLDNQWRGSFRQRMAAIVAPWYIRRFIDVLWVAGERQRRFAGALGYSGARCWDGFYACEWERFAGKAGTTRVARNPSFLFVGRYVEAKGVRDLAEAYRMYRIKVENPWPLVCAGKGDLTALLTEAGAEDRGFVQPENLPQLMHESSAFVLPSRFEPWGVVVQEAAASALPLIVSDACGASVHLLRDGYNGFLIEGGNRRSLESAMIRMHELSEAGRQECGLRSFELSKQYTPERWARTFRDGLAMLRSGGSA